MDVFDLHPQTRFVIGDDRIDTLGGLAAELGAERTLVVSDPGIIAAGHTARGCAALNKSGIDHRIFSDIQENPTTVHVDHGVEVAKSYGPDLIIGLGGGSSMDCAKGINFLYSGGGRMQDYWGIGKAKKPMLPMIAVPTTAGTGSEAQSFALISDPQTHAKMACGDKKAAFRIAVLDPKLTLTQPPQVTAVTGLDAIAHAVETFVCNKRTELSDRFALDAWQLVTAGFLSVLEAPHDLEARRQMQLGACLAGMAIENAMLGAAHATANPLTANYDLVHGHAVGIMLPHVVRFNALEVANQYNKLASEIGRRGGAGALADYLTELLQATGLKTRLSELQVAHNRLPQLAKQAAGQWTANFNPRPVDESTLLTLYQAAY
jgi:alcohol dehydrogenase